MRKLIVILLMGIFMVGLASAALTNITYIYDEFDTLDFANWTDNGATDWDVDSTYVGAGTTAAHCGPAQTTLYSDNMDMSDAVAIYISFAYQVDDLDANDDLFISYYDGAVYDLIDEIGDDAEDTWLTFFQKITDAQYFDNGFHILIDGTSVDVNENIWIENVSIIKEYNLNAAPVIANVTGSHSTIKGGETITIYANTTFNGVNDTDVDSLTLYCDTTDTPTAANTDCTGGTTTDATYPYDLTCTFATAQTDQLNVEYCRIYDGTTYSAIVPNHTYTTDSTAPSLTVSNVAGDTAASYYDTVDDSVTQINITGEAEMLCRWSDTDLSYSAMSNDCTIGGSTANCSINDVAAQGLTTRYISCQDNLTNEHTSANNLEVLFTLDYTDPTTTDNSNTNIQAPPYSVTITEQDNVDADPTTLYCTDIVDSCVPSITIDDGGIVTFTSANRGVNYLRVNSSDGAGNTQAIQSSTININQLPVFTSASDNATTIGGGELVNITTVSTEPDSQEITLWVCNSANVTFEGCGDTEYCNASASDNATCVFTAESDSASHTWYAFIFDDSDETAVTNFSGSYTTDSTSPVITLVIPTNGSTITQDSVTLTISVDEALSSAWYSLDGGTTNVTMTNTTLTSWTYTNSSIADGLYYMTFWANDSYGNDATLIGNSFTINATLPDTTPPTITSRSPTDNSYDTDGSVLLNMTTDEDVTWAGYTNNSGTLTDLDNTSKTSWNSTLNFAEGIHEIIFYANDSSNNQGTASATVYVDLTNASVTTFSCTDVNDSENVVCTIAATDAIGLENYKIGYNATGTWVNSSLISFTGTSNSTTYTILSGNHSPLGFSTKLYVYDLSGRLNNTETDDIVISDDTLPVINNYTYVPNAIDDLDPAVEIKVNTTITEDYNISSVVLMYYNMTSSSWNITTMTNNSVLTVGSSSTVVYNASFTPEAGSWTFKINATDFAGNENISANTTIVVEDDISEEITTTILDVKSITYAQRIVNNSLGYLNMNNTGDATMSFNVSLSSTDADIQSRLSVNYTDAQTGNFSTASLDATNITIDVNTTDLIADVYDYNVTIVSEVGTTVLEKQLNIQVADGPYLVTSITTYSSSVTQGDTDVSYVATVTNLGTSDATGVYLNWTLPSEFSLASGSLTRNLGNLGVSVGGTNTITVNVDSDASAGDVNIVANATSSNADSASDSKTVGVGTVVTPVTPTTPSAGGGGSSGISIGGGEFTSYDKEIEVVRGESIEFEIEVYNKYVNSTLEDVEILLLGFSDQYITITPSKILGISYEETGIFVVTIETPSYHNYEEYDLRAIITGSLVRAGGRGVNYKEIQDIKLVVQAVTEEESRFSLEEAEKVLQAMRDAGFNVEEAERLLEEAMVQINSSRNKQAKDLADELVVLSERAFETDSLIRNVMNVVTDPRRSRILLSPRVSGFAIEDFDVDGYFVNHPAVELIELARVAFERGDYALAKRRADSAKSMVLFAIKGNFWLWIVLYWPFILLGGLLLSFGGVVGYRRYRKSSVTRSIGDLNNKEDNIRKLIGDSQASYFAGKISSSEYHRAIEQHQKKLSIIKKDRIGLRNQRIKMLGAREIVADLQIERMQIESEIKKLQTDYYKDFKISEQEYKLQFEVLNERLAEIEDERTTLGISKNKKLIRDKSKVDKKVVKSEGSSKETSLKSVVGFASGISKKAGEVRKSKIHGDKKVEKHIKKDERKIKVREKFEGFINNIKSKAGKVAMSGRGVAKWLWGSGKKGVGKTKFNKDKKRSCING